MIKDEDRSSEIILPLVDLGSTSVNFGLKILASAVEFCCVSEFSGFLVVSIIICFHFFQATSDSSPGKMSLISILMLVDSVFRIQQISS